MKKVVMLFLALIVGIGFVTEGRTATRKKCWRPRPDSVTPPAGVPICPPSYSTHEIKRYLHQYFAEEEKAFPELKAYLDDESKPPFKFLKQKAVAHLAPSSFIHTLEQRESFAKETGMNSHIGVANIAAVERIPPLRKKLEEERALSTPTYEAFAHAKAEVSRLTAERTLQQGVVNEKKKAYDSAKEEHDKAKEERRRKDREADDMKIDDIGGPIWTYRKELKVAADRVEDVAKVLESQKGFAKDAIDKVFQEVGIDPAQLAKDVRTMADAMRPMDLWELDQVKGLLQGRWNQAKQEHDRIYSSTDADRQEVKRLNAEIAAIRAEVDQRDGWRREHDRKSEELVGKCASDPLGCPVYLAQAAAERAAAAAEQGHIGLLRIRELGATMAMMAKSPRVAFADLSLEPHKTIMDKLDEQIKAIDKAKEKLTGNIAAQKDKNKKEYDPKYQRYLDTGYDKAAAVGDYGRLDAEVKKWEKERDSQGSLAAWSDEKLGELETELAKHIADSTKGGAPAVAVAQVQQPQTQAQPQPARSVQALSAPSPSHFGKPEFTPEPEYKPMPKPGGVQPAPAVENEFTRLARQFQEDDLKKEVRRKAAVERIAGERQKKMAEHEKVMAQKQKEVAALEKKAADAAAEAKRIAVETEVKKKAQEELARKKAEEEKLKDAKRLAEEQAQKKMEAERQKKLAEEEAAKKKEQEELAKRQKLMEEAMRKKQEEELAKKQRESVPQLKREPEPASNEPLIAAPPPPPPPATSAPKTGMRPKYEPQKEEEPVYRAPPAPPSHEEVEIEKKEEEETTVWRHPEPRGEEATPQCDRGTWSPTFQRCIEDEAPEETQRPDCPGGTHWSPTLRSCQPD